MRHVEKITRTSGKANGRAGVKEWGGGGGGWGGVRVLLRKRQP